MADRSPFLLWTELNSTTMPALQECMTAAETTAVSPRSYPGYPIWPLDAVRPRWQKSLDRVLLQRRCVRVLGSETPSRASLSRLLYYSHGTTSEFSRGPTPSAG